MKLAAFSEMKANQGRKNEVEMLCVATLPKFGIMCTIVLMRLLVLMLEIELEQILSQILHGVDLRTVVGGKSTGTTDRPFSSAARGLAETVQKLRIQ